MKRWTKEEEKLILKKIKYDHRGFVCNYRELAELFGCEVKIIHSKVLRMRRKEQLFEIYWSDPINPPVHPFSSREKDRIISLYTAGCPIATIARELDQTESAITNKINRLFKSGKLKPNRHRPYTKEDINLLLKEIKFDENGYVLNMDYLARILNRRKYQISRKIFDMRKAGMIKTMPDKSKSSKNWYDAMKKQIDISYQLCVAKQKEPTSSANEVSY
ncbi:hypothetical protein M9773_000152 [Enterococcus faecalis]|uniref:hypothetical protein n=1 Tax=Enterococcus faecalis TaxID=1351 RepID=UPI000CF01511|nr:hypothetical protein [Enterococcus faecalis]EGO2679319.1 hypothetical protein [Enterococcus faecalis]EGO5130483.1 hypothetical protein [Enterococcus faecalis]EGO6130192.1 hypothetical protein [Enterococcus faecalis]EGO8789318.1 hypothetical protein [Enterococcus faecalis]EGO9061467.1 hypothetical protein [Enterococcus faecalis]